jgi:hypothetical protein
MHSVDLATKHALLIAKRTKNGRDVDNWPEGVAFRQRVHRMISYLMDKKSKGRFKFLNELSQKRYGCDAIRLELPNKTRISGFYRMLKCALISKGLIQQLKERDDRPACFKDADKYLLWNDDWVNVAEFEAVL